MRGMKRQKGNRKIYADDDDDDDDEKMSLYWEESASLLQSAGMSRLVC